MPLVTICVASTLLFSGSNNQAALAATGTVTGTVFNDKNSNGTNDGSDAGVSGVVVTAYDSTGAQVGTATSAGNGTYSLSVSSSATADVRIEFTTPNGYESSFQGAGNGTSIQFVSLPATNVDFGVLVLGNFCQDNPGSGVAAICLRPGTTSLASSKTASSISKTSWRGTGPSLLTKNEDTGSLWGMAFDSQRQVIFASAALRRHSGLGPKGIAGLYATSSATGGVVASWDLSQAPFNLTFSANNSNFSDANRGLDNSNFLSADPIGYANVGKVGIGDIDMSPNGQWLFVSNLYEKKIHRIAVSDANSDGVPELGAVTSFTIPANTCSSTTSRPWGLNYNSQDNTVLIGVTCSKETQTPTLNTVAGTTSLPDPAVIVKLTISSSTFSTISTVDLDYVRGVEIVGGSNPGQTCNTSDPSVSTPTGAACLRVRWHSWTDDFAAIESLPGAGFGMEGVLNFPTDGSSASVQKTWWPQPLIADIEVLPSGQIVLGVMDRFGMQMGTSNRKPTYSAPNVNADLVTGYVAGDTLMLCPSGGSYIQNNADGCTAATSDDSYMLSRGGLGGKRDYHEVFDDNLNDGGHMEMTIGGLAYNPATKELAVTMMDPANTWNTGGIRYLNSDTSSSTFGQYVSGAAFNGSSDSGNNQTWTSSFLKSTSMGDIELICDRAPVQIGNRVWIDSNLNGIQDPGEPPVAGVYIFLYAATGDTGVFKHLSMVRTNANGEFYFSSNVTEDSWQNDPDHIGGGLVLGQSYRLRMDWPAEWGGPAAAPAGYELTQADALSNATALDTSVDNNATLVNSYPQVTVATVASGANNHTYDFGFKLIEATTTTTSTTTTSTTTTSTTTTTTLPTTSTTTTTTLPTTSSTSSTTTSTSSSTTSTTTSSTTSTTTSTPNVPSLTTTPIPTSTPNTPTTSVAPNAPATTANNSSTTDPTPIPNVSPEGSSKRSDYPGNFNGGSGNGSGANNTPVWNGSDLAPTDEGVNVGGFVWIDSTKNGRQSSSERGISGVVLVLVDENGNPARDINGNTVLSTVTDSSGHYLFPRLAPGKYRVIIQDPSGYRSTIPGAGQRAGDSSKGSAVSLNLSQNGDFDLTLDFGYVPTQNLPATGQEMPSLRIGFISLILGICFVLRRRLHFQQN